MPMSQSRPSVTHWQPHHVHMREFFFFVFAVHFFPSINSIMNITNEGPTDQITVEPVN